MTYSVRSLEAVALWRVRGQTQEIACALIELGWGCFYAGDADARRLMEEGFSLQQSVGDRCSSTVRASGFCRCW